MAFRNGKLATLRDKEISKEDARFVFGDGGAAAISFQQQHKTDPEFGAVWVEYSPFAFQIRTTSRDSKLPYEFDKLLGRSSTKFVGGRSFAKLVEERQSINSQLREVQEDSGRNLVFAIHPDSTRGTLSLEINRKDLNAIDDLQLPNDVRLIVSDIVPDRPANYAGAIYNATQGGCTTGYAAKNYYGGRFVVTAAHCYNTGAVSGGYSLGAVFAEQCQDVDRQAFPTSAPNLYNGFYDYYGTWRTIAEVAGGWYVNQPFTRKGRYTDALGTIADADVKTFGGGNGDCGSYQAFTFPLWNTQGGTVQGGDSGGPLMLHYANKFFLAGTTTGVGVQSQGRSAWIDVPPGLAECTSLTPCS